MEQSSSSPLTIASDRLRLTASADSFDIGRISDPRTGAVYTRTGSHTILLRTPDAVFEPIIMVRVLAARKEGDAVVFRYADESGAYRTELRVEPFGRGLRFSLDAVGPKPLWIIEWRLSGLAFDEVIVPALGGQSLSKEMPNETTLSYKYPFWWNAQFVIGARARGGLWLYARDPEPHLKLLRVRKEAKSFALTYGVEAPGPLRSRRLSARWYLESYDGDWTVPVKRHRQWMEYQFGLTPLSKNPAMPSWGHDIDFVLEMWGMTKDRPEPLHTFPAMADRLKAWRKLHDPRTTLVYLPGYAMHGIDSHAPSYDPSQALGGARGFASLVKAAHKMGYRVMIHTNVLAMTFLHPLYPKFKRYQVVDCFNRPQGWGLDMDGDWLAEPYFAYMNPGHRAWGDLMERIIGRLIRRFDIDGVFLDQTLLAFNTGRGPNFVEGMRNHVLRLQRAFPGVLFAGEGLHEQIVEALPMAQIHGIDSIAEVHALDGTAPWRRAHPVSTTLFGPYTRFTAHLLTKHPSHPMFAAQEAAYAALGVIPALCLYNHQQRMDLPHTRTMVRRARRLRHP